MSISLSGDVLNAFLRQWLVSSNHQKSQYRNMQHNIFMRSTVQSVGKFASPALFWKLQDLQFWLIAFYHLFNRAGSLQMHQSLKGINLSRRINNHNAILRTNRTQSVQFCIHLSAQQRMHYLTFFILYKISREELCIIHLAVRLDTTINSGTKIQIR